MKINTKVRYGLRTMVEIARNPDGILQKDISENQSISSKYLDQIIAGLKVAGLITSVAGKRSGYRLMHPIEEITVYDVYKAFEFDLNISSCESQGVECPFKEDCFSKNYWCELNSIVKNHMQSKTLKMVMNESRKETNKNL